MNDVAMRVIEECRGAHDEYVFVWRRERVKNVDKSPTAKKSGLETQISNPNISSVEGRQPRG
jgi:hypothetical protein